VARGWLKLAMMECYLTTLKRTFGHLGKVSPVIGGIAGEDCELFWSTGVLEYWNVGNAESPISI
jgi:hypothetical protein